MKMTSMKNKSLRKYRFIKILAEKVAYLWFLFWHVCFYFFKIKNNKIVVSNYYGKGYGDNPKYIVNTLLKKKLNLDIVWIVDNFDYELPKEIRKCKKYSIKSIYEFMTSKIWIDNCRKYYFYNILKKSDTFYIQTWHGGVGLKRCERDVENKLNKNYVLSAKKDSKLVDYFLSCSEWQTRYFKKYFWYKNIILEYGLPRNDIFFYPQVLYKDKIYSFYNIKKDIKIVLVAPTFRNNQKVDEIIDFKKLQKSLEKKFDSEWVILLRLHPNIRDISVNLPKNVLNVSQYEDIQELLCASDILITDYSSIMFDMLLLGKPVFIYAKDISDYANERNFTFEFSKLPFSIASNDIQLSNNINDFNKIIYDDNILSFKNKLGLYDDGHASEKVCELIEKIMNGKVQK